MLASYNPRGGDLIFFGGADASDVEHLVAEFVSNGIALLTHSNLTHLGMLLDPELLIDGKPQQCWNLIESTILNGKSGPQINPADSRIQGYPGIVFLARLSTRTRSMLDWNSLWAYLVGKVGQDHYSIKGIADFLGRMVPFIGKVPWFSRPEKNAEVCSEYLAGGFRASGLPGIRGHLASPQTLAEWAIYEGLLQLSGPPATIRNFNTL